MTEAQSPPGVSVLMSVHQAGDEIDGTIASVLDEHKIDLQFVIVADGCAPPVLENLLDWQARDARINLITRPHQGLTAALAAGLDHCRYEFVARIDAGDICLPERLQRQARYLLENGQVAFVGGSYELIAPRGELLFRVEEQAGRINASLRQPEDHQLETPAHHSVMFRRSLVQHCGGYRSQYYFAQDTDLWLRLIEHGEFATISDTVTRARFDPAGISGRYRDKQLEARRLAVECARARQKGESESRWLEQASMIRPDTDSDEQETVSGWYFIARSLSKRNPVVARYYYGQVLRRHPLHLKAWLFLLFNIAGIHR